MILKIKWEIIYQKVSIKPEYLKKKGLLVFRRISDLSKHFIEYL